MKLNPPVDINENISPDMFHSVFSCVFKSIIIIIFDSLNENEKQNIYEGFPKINNLLKNWQSLDITEMGLWDIDDFLHFSFLSEIVFENVLDETKFKMLHYLCSFCGIILRKKINFIYLEQAELLYRKSLKILFDEFSVDLWKEKPTFHKNLHLFNFIKNNGCGKIHWVKHFEIYHLNFKKILKKSNYNNCVEFLRKKHQIKKNLKIQFSIKNENNLYSFSENIQFLLLEIFLQDEKTYIEMETKFGFEYKMKNINLIKKLIISNKELSHGDIITYYDDSKLNFGEIKEIYFSKKYNNIILNVLKYEIDINDISNYLDIKMKHGTSLVLAKDVLGANIIMKNKINIMWIE